ncbi:hypothetical protein ElyMa_003902400 [Elysia marginata]|uniref:Uncharacterized protein n=1 Tax=Elysia marginata TaxID=1093978 RepID=A0AAV4FPQ7_9GAST|nr:hypothetical protein ElyMa_003902400 [Elysia marginata]
MSLVEIQVNCEEVSAMENVLVTPSEVACSDYLSVSPGKFETLSHSRCNSWKGRLGSSDIATNSPSQHNYRRRKSSPRLTRSNSASMPDCSNNSTTNKRNSIITTTTDATPELRNSYDNCPVCMVRSFKTTSKGNVVNTGSFCRVPSSNSLRSSGSLNTSHNTSMDSGSRRSSGYSQRAGSIDSGSGDENRPTWLVPPEVPNICVTPSYFRTLVLGSAGVGKTSLVQQFVKAADIQSNGKLEQVLVSC